MILGLRGIIVNGNLSYKKGELLMSITPFTLIEYSTSPWTIANHRKKFKFGL